LRLGRAPSLISLLVRTPIFGWLLCPLIKWRPSKAKAQPLYLIFCLVAARQWQVRRLLIKVVAKFRSYILQSSGLQKLKISRII
jgi:hypothetical protein